MARIIFQAGFYVWKMLEKGKEQKRHIISMGEVSERTSKNTGLKFFVFLLFPLYLFKRNVLRKTNDPARGAALQESCMEKN
jgi:hypothetical protein